MAASALALCFILAVLGRSANDTFTVYVLPISTAFGWDRAEVVSIYSVALLAMGLSGPIVGRLFDSRGPRFVYVGGMLLLGGGYGAGSFAKELWQLQLCGLACGFGSACLGNITASLMLNRWFGPKLPSAMGVVFAATGVGMLTLVPLSQVLVQLYGWRGGYQITGATFLILLLPVALAPWRALAAGSFEVRSPTKTSDKTDDWTLAAALRRPEFWGLFSTFFFTGVGVFGIAVQIVPYLVTVGYSPIEAATYWGFSGVVLVAGLQTVSSLDAMLGRIRTMILSYGLSTAGLVMLWLLSKYPSPWLLIGFLVCFGSTMGSRGPLVAATAMTIFRGRRAGTIFGTISIGSGLGPAIGSWMGGIVHDVTQSYDWVIGFAVLSLWLGMLPFLSLRVLRKE